MDNRLTGTDQVSVCSWFRFVRSKVLRGHFLGRLSVTQDAQQADEQQPAEQPGAIHGAGGGGGGGGGGGSRSGVEEQRVAAGPQEILPPPTGPPPLLYGLMKPRPGGDRAAAGGNMREGDGCVRGRQAAGLTPSFYR